MPEKKIVAAPPSRQQTPTATAHATPTKAPKTAQTTALPAAGAAHKIGNVAMTATGSHSSSSTTHSVTSMSPEEEEALAALKLKEQLAVAAPDVPAASDVPATPELPDSDVPGES